MSRLLRRGVARHRGLLVAVLVAVALGAGLVAARPPAPATTQIVVAAHDLQPGHGLGPDDIATVGFDPDLVPDGAYEPADAPLGQVVAGPVRGGEPLTDASVVGAGLAGGLAGGEVLTTVHVRDPAASLVAPGDVVTVVAADPQGSASAEVLARSATVVTSPIDSQGTTTGTAGVSPLVLALPETEALAVSSAATARVLDVLVPAPTAR